MAQVENQKNKSSLIGGLPCICIRGHFEEYFYDENGNQTETIDMVPGGVVLNIEKGQWHSLKCLESGTILFEAKDGPYHPIEEDEVFEHESH